MYPSYWDIPGGSVEHFELPQEAAVRDCLKETVFTRLVYEAILIEKGPIVLDEEEHVAYRWISSLDDLLGEKWVPYLDKLIEKKTS